MVLMVSMVRLKVLNYWRMDVISGYLSLSTHGKSRTSPRQEWRGFYKQTLHGVGFGLVRSNSLLLMLH